MIVSTKRWCVYYHYIEKICIYVGSGCAKRPYETFRSKKWHALVKKNNFCVDIRVVRWFDVLKEARAYEAKRIKVLHPICNKFHNGFRFKKSTVSKRSKACRRTLKNRPKEITDRWKKNNSESHKGQKNAMKGKQHTLESRKNMSVAHMGIPLPEAQKKRLSEFWTGKPKSAETKSRMKLAWARKRKAK